MKNLFAVVVSIALLAGAVPGRATETRIPQSRQEITLSFAPLVKQVAPAVVNIYTKRVIKEKASPFFNDPFFRQFFGNQFFGVPRQRIQNSLGSGVILRSDGLIVTNNHVIDKADQITVVLSDRREFEAKVLLADERADLAVLRIDTHGEKLPVLKLMDSDDLQVGDLVLAIGNPFGVGQTVTSGIVSAVARAAEGISDYSYFIQTDAAINPGNSGGALVGMDGRLVGINSAIYSRSGGSLGIGFAIPANMVARVLDAALHGGKVVRPWLGVDSQAVTSDLASSVGLKRPEGVIVRKLDPAGPAAKAGLRVGDIVLAVDGREVDDPGGLRFRIASLPVGRQARLTILRDGAQRQIVMPLEKPPEVPRRDISKIDGRNPFSGATVANLSPAVDEEMSLDTMTRGVIVTGVEDNSPAGQLGLNAGDVIVKVDGTPIDTVATLKRALRRSSGRWAVVIRRNGKLLSVVVQG
jgi:serine protease Do